MKKSELYILTHETIKDLVKARHLVRLAREYMVSPTGCDVLTELDLVLNRRGDKLEPVMEAYTKET
jgi:hypothetical protein